jgi:NodT family efflux transporter outer membrane factor (OMF) lipoprotein
MKQAAWPVLAISLAGCALPPPVHTQLAQSGVSAPARWSTAGTAPAPVAGGWLRDLDDPVLGNLVREAVGGNLDLRVAAARVRQAQARTRITGAAALPRIDVGGGGTRRSAASASGQRVTGNSFDLTAGAAWEVDVWNRLADRTRAAFLDEAASAADLQAARLSLAANVARAWFDAVEAGLQVELARETVDNFRDNLEVVMENFRAGLASALDVRLERANLASAQSRLAAREVDRDTAVRRVEVLLGRYPGDALAVADTLPPLTGAVPAGLPAEMLARRPDVRAAAVRLAATDARLDAALKNRLPGLTLTGNGGVSSDALRRLLDFDAVLLAIAAELTAPLLRGGELQAERDLARAQTDEALAQYAQAVLTAFREVESALRAEALLAQQEAALQIAARESRAAEELALERYRAGLVDIVTWLEARRRAFDARSALLSVNNQRLQNRIALHLGLGGDFTAPATDAAMTAPPVAPGGAPR